LKMPGCVLTVAATQGEPFSVYYENRSITGPQEFLIHEITKPLDFRLIKLNQTRTEYYKFINLNLFNKKVDIGYGPTPMELIDLNFSTPTFNYLQDELTFFVPSPRLQIFSQLYSGLSNIIWGLIAATMVTFIFISVGIRFWTNKQEKSFSALDVVQLTLGQSASAHERSMANTFLIFIYEVYSAHIIWFYQSVLLFSLFQGAYEKAIETFKDAADSSLVFHTTPFFMNYVNKSDHENWMKFMDFGRFKLSVPPDLSLVAENRTAIALTLKLFGLYNFLRRYPGIPLSEKVKIIKKPLQYVHLVLLMPINHPLFPVLSRNVLSVFESGLYEFWLSFYKPLEKVQITDNQKPLSVTNMQPAFYLMSGFFILCLIIFTLECCYNHFRYEKQNGTEINTIKPGAYLLQMNNKSSCR